jgi:Cof subfamily protein (haloacid dehalogenase superfamily)
MAEGESGGGVTGGSVAPAGAPDEALVAPDPDTIRAVALDIDGTLLTPEGHVAPRTAAAVRAVLARGVLVVLCTGRGYAYGVGQLARELRLHLPAIVRNGAAVQDLADGRVLAQRRLPPGTLARALEVIAAAGATPMVLQGPVQGDAICTPPPEHCHPAVAFYARLWSGESPFRREVAPEALAAIEDTTWVAGAGDHGTAHELYQALSHLPGVAVAWSGSDGRVREFEFAAVKPPCTKATALAEFAVRHGIGLQQIMAVGDYLNDVEMLREVGWGVAMGQAPDIVKAAADAVTLDNGRDGCAVAIERYVLGLHPGRRSPAVGG